MTKNNIYTKFRTFVFSNIFWYLPKETAHKILYRKIMKKKLNLQSPKDYNEKLQYLMIKYGVRETLCSDKYKVREYIEEKKLGEILPKLYGVYSDAKDIEWEKLPSKFVLKTNHGCGNTIVCTDLNKFNKEKAIIELNKSLHEDYGKATLEYHYSKIKPRIICEEYLDDHEHFLPIDYKISCFSGKPECVLICSDREHKMKRTYYDLNWNKLDYLKVPSNENFDKPKNWEKMIEISRILSEDFPFVRVDLYNINGKIYFGELTFSPAGGINKTLNQNALNYLGDLINLEYKSNKEGN